MRDRLVDCNARIRSDTVGRITVDPLHGFGRAVVLADIAHEFSLKIGHRGKNATSNDIALNFGEPKLDLISQEE